MYVCAGLPMYWFVKKYADSLTLALMYWFFIKRTDFYPKRRFFAFFKNIFVFLHSFWKQNSQ